MKSAREGRIGSQYLRWLKMMSFHATEPEFLECLRCSYASLCAFISFCCFFGRDVVDRYGSARSPRLIIWHDTIRECLESSSHLLGKICRILALGLAGKYGYLLNMTSTGSFNVKKDS